MFFQGRAEGCSGDEASSSATTTLLGCGGVCFIGLSRVSSTIVDNYCIVVFGRTTQASIPVAGNICAKSFLPFYKTPVKTNTYPSTQSPNPSIR